MNKPQPTRNDEPELDAIADMTQYPCHDRDPSHAIKIKSSLKTWRESLLSEQSQPEGHSQVQRGQGRSMEIRTTGK